MAADEARVDAFLPLSVKDFYILFTLAGAPLHGYAIVQEVEDRTDGMIRLEPANLYRRIHRFVAEGLLEESPTPPDEEPDGRRRYYRLTELGRSVLESEVARWSSLVTEAGRVGLA